MDDVRHLSLQPEQGFLLGHDEHTPGHVHPQGHLVYPARGVLSLATAEGTWIAPPNRIVWIPEGFEHQHSAHGVTDMRIVFVPPTVAKLLPAHPVVLVMTPLAREAIMALTSSDGRSAPARARLRRVVIDDITAAPEQPLHLPEPRDERLRAVKYQVEQDLSSPDTLADIGRRIGVGERTLSRLFHEETGMSFRQWRIQLRIHRSLILLAEGSSVIDAGVACGWANPSAFITIFTNLVGQTPGRYRRALAVV